MNDEKSIQAEKSMILFAKALSKISPSIVEINRNILNFYKACGKIDLDKRYYDKSKNRI